MERGCDHGAHRTGVIDLLPSSLPKISLLLWRNIRIRICSRGPGKSDRRERSATYDKWWDGYHGEETVIFDGLKGSSMRLHDFQLIVDRYPVKVETKGSTVELSATTLVFTSNKHPSEWYSGDADPEGTVMRRINEFCADRGRLIHLGGPSSLGRPRVNVLEVKLEVGVILDPTPSF